MQSLLFVYCTETTDFTPGTIFEDAFQSPSQRHLRHGAPVTGAQELHLHHAVIGHINELHIAAVGLQAGLMSWIVF
jgi:hypothetical protein